MADIIDGLYSWVSFLPRITKTNLIEIIIIAILLYELLVWIMNTRAWTLLKGILLILCFYVLTYIFRLDNIKWILNTIATPAVTMAIVIFQPELRKALEQLGSRNPLTGILTFDDGKDNSAFTDRTINELVKATFEMAKVKTGALMVIERGDSLKEIERTGIEVNGLVSSQLLIKQMKEANKKKEEKIKELQEFISRFSANASKSKQATSRKRALEKIELDDIKPSSRKYPYIDFRPEREIGNEVLAVEHLSKTINGEKVLDDISFTLGREDKVAFVGSCELAKTTLFQILAGEIEPDEGTYKWGVTTSQSYFPKDNTAEFDNDMTIADWLTGYSPVKDATYVRGFLGRMLFAGEDGVKKVRILSGGEKVRCLLSKMMISGANCLILDEPTNHLDMESITALNNGLIKFPGVALFSCHDHQFVQTTANRIIEILPNGSLVDKITTYDEYLASDEMARKRTVFTAQTEDDEN